MHGTHNVTSTHCNMMRGTHNVKLVDKDVIVVSVVASKYESQNFDLPLMLKGIICELNLSSTFNKGVKFHIFKTGKFED